MAIEMTSPLKVKGLCKQYPAFRLEDVSFELVPGSITGFIGRNGAGKTTTINSILAFVKPWCRVVLQVLSDGTARARPQPSTAFWRL